MTTPDQHDEMLWAAIESGKLDGPLAEDPELAKEFAAHQKLESLFELLRRPADAILAGDQLDHPTKIGRYRVCRVLGRGAFGTVYLADDPELDRPVAVKVPSPGRFSSQQDTERFLEEAKFAAQLKHPGIVTVHDVGRDGDLCYIVMEYVQGRTLQELMAAGERSPAQAAGLVARVADALHYAHKKGFVHRDLKPTKILIDDQGNPHVTDFGLAVSEDSQRLHAGQVAGTPAYMSPEQVRGETQHLDGRTDIWSLGVILYQLLTGRHPFWRGDAAECLDEIQHREPKPPRQIEDMIPPELEQIVLKCLAKRTTERYSTAGDLAADLRNRQLTRGDGLPSHHAQPVGTAHVTQRPTRWVLAGILLVAVSVVIAWVVHSTVSPAEDLTGTIDVQIWNSEDSRRRNLSLTDEGALPLIPGDQIRIEASVSRPSYLYLVWISTDGKAAPVYPWIPGNWDQQPEREAPVSAVSLPKGSNTGWPMQGPTGMETLVLLARKTPLPAGVRLKDLFSGFPKQEIQDPRAVVWLDQGKVVDTVERAPQFFNPQEIEDPVLATQRLLAERLNPHFQLIRAVSFANVVQTRKIGESP